MPPQSLTERRLSPEQPDSGTGTPAAATRPVGGRTFILVRHRDPSGVSGVGVVAQGVQFADGTAVVRWLGVKCSTAVWGSIEDVAAVHGHDGATRIAWDDERGAGS